MFYQVCRKKRPLWQPARALFRGHYESPLMGIFQEQQQQGEAEGIQNDSHR